MIFFLFWITVSLLPQLLGFQVCATVHSSIMLELVCDLTFQGHVLSAGDVEIGKPLRAGGYLEVIRWWRDSPKALIAVMQGGFPLSKVEFYKTGWAWLFVNLLFLVLPYDFFLTCSHRYDSIHHEALTRAQKMPVPSWLCSWSWRTEQRSPPPLSSHFSWLLSLF